MKNGYSSGIPLGYMHDETDVARPRRRKLAYGRGRHLITIGPTGSGKNVTVIFPTLLEHDASCFVIDPKGENAAVTARRRREMGHKVVIVNPYGEIQNDLAARGFPRPQRFNPLASLAAPTIATSQEVALPSAVETRTSAAEQKFVARCQGVAEALVFNQSHDPHWSDSARQLANCAIMYVCIEPNEERSLGRVRELLTQPPDDLKQLLARMATSPYRPLRQKVGQFLATSNEILSVMSTARTQTAFLDDPAIAASLSGSDFQFSEMKTRKMTVYLILHPELIASDYVRWLRLLLTSALSEVMASPERGRYPVLFLLDEFAALGEMSVISAAMSLARGYGIQMWPFLQDWNQLQELYGDRAESFIANAEVLQFFAPGEDTTAQKISALCGVRTTYGQSINFGEISKGQAQGGFTGRSNSYSVTQTPLMYPHQVRGLARNRQILFHRNAADEGSFSSPIMAGRWPYNAPDTSIPGVTDYTGLYDPNPYDEDRRARR